MNIVLDRWEENGVYDIIDDERKHQDRIWNELTTTTEGNHSWEEWFMYIEDYVNEAKHILSRKAQPEAGVKASDIMRKVAAMAVAAMENNGARKRPEWRTEQEDKSL